MVVVLTYRKDIEMKTLAAVKRSRTCVGIRRVREV